MIRRSRLADDIHRARLTALSLAHGSALSRLLRTHGRGDHADHLELALQEIYSIVATELGGATLSDAIRWLAEQGDDDSAEPALGLRH